MNADILFYVAVLMNLFAIALGVKLYRQIKGSTIGKLVLYTTLSALIFGIHFLGEAALDHNSIPIHIEEFIEFAAAVLLLCAVYQIYRISNEVFIPETYVESRRK